MSKHLKSSTAIDTNFDPSSFEKALAAEDQSLGLGSKVRGLVIKVTSNEIFVDIGYKSEGRIRLSEFRDQVPVEGDVVEAIFNGEDAEGNVDLSFAKLQRAQLEAQLQEGRVLKAKVGKLITKRKGEEDIPVGFQVELAPGVTAFVPQSQIDLHPAPPESYIGNVMEFRIERIEMKGRYQNIVLSRRKLLEEDLQNRQEQFFLSHKVGDVVRGRVRSFAEFGAFIDLGGFSGLLHVVNMAWHSFKKPQEIVDLGDELELQISDMDPNSKKVGLSLKAMQPDPWDSVAEKFQVEQIVEGRVRRLQNYGAFVELSPGIEGLVHVSEMSWIRQIKHPKEVLKVGDRVKVQILELEDRRIRLGLRQTEPDPWLSVAERYPVGARLRLKVKNVVKSGAFLTLEEGIDGFLHQDDLSWSRRLNINEVAKVGQSLEVQVLSIEDRRIRLGVKQLENNPWQELKNLRKGAVIEGSVVSKAEFGIFVRINGGIEGLVHKNDLTNDRAANSEALLKSYKKGDRVRALIIEIDEKKRRLGLSIKAVEREEEQQSLNRYLLKNDDINPSYTLGDIISK